MKNGVYYDTLKEIIKINSFNFRSKYTAFYRGGPGLRVLRSISAAALLQRRIALPLCGSGSSIIEQDKNILDKDQRMLQEHGRLFGFWSHCNNTLCLII